MKRSKSYRAAAEKIDRDLAYAPLEAIRLVKDGAKKTYDETVEVAFRLGIDPRKADQMVRGTVNLPHGTGKTARVIVFAEGEDERVLRAANAILEEGDDVPILIGRPEVIARRAERAGLPIRPERDFEIVNPESDSRYRDYWETYHRLMARRGVTPDVARSIMRTNTTAIGAAYSTSNAMATGMVCTALK